MQQTSTHQAEALLRMALMGMAEGLLMQDNRGNLLFSNGAALRMLGLTEGQLRGVEAVVPGWQTLREDGSPLRPEAHPSAIALRTHVAQRDVVIGIQRPDHTRCWLSVSAVPLFAAGAIEPHGVVTTFSEIDAPKYRSNGLRRSSSRLEKSAYSIVDNAGSIHRRRSAADSGPEPVIPSIADTEPALDTARSSPHQATPVAAPPSMGRAAPRGLGPAIAGAFARAHRAGGSCSLLLVEIDDFAELRARGVAAQVVADAESVLNGEHASSVLHAGSDDGRLAVVLFGFGREEATFEAESLRTRLARAEGARQPLTVSIGLAAIAEDTVTPETWLEHVEEALSVAVRRGRNRVVRF